MGILKHAVLPILAVVNAYIAKICLIDEGLVEKAAAAYNRDMTKEPPTAMEQHLTRVIGGVQIALLVNSAVAVLQENAHYRGMATVMQAIFFGADSYSYVKSGRKDGFPVYCMFGLSLVGLGVHALEPGVFTRDKCKQ
jgi:hypothetical protein